MKSELFGPSYFCEHIRVNYEDTDHTNHYANKTYHVNTSHYGPFQSFGTGWLVVLLFYVHGKQTESCQNGQLT